MLLALKADWNVSCIVHASETVMPFQPNPDIFACTAPCRFNSGQISEGFMAMQCEMITYGLALVAW